MTKVIQFKPIRTERVIKKARETVSQMAAKIEAEREPGDDSHTSLSGLFHAILEAEKVDILAPAPAPADKHGLLGFRRTRIFESFPKPAPLRLKPDPDPIP